VKRAPFYLALGSNLGQREEYLRQALNRLIDRPEIRLLRLSPLYQTEPVGLTNQPFFLNMVVMGETSLSVHALFQMTSYIELALGRERTIRWGPRTIDIDLLLYDQLVVSTHELEVPHPRLTERAFVLIPLADIAADVIIPGRGESVGNILAKVSRKGVERWTNRFILGADGYVHIASSSA
jgi:2-amino-4-hydroxy-6-hydroxymethyldihydropteridine diphosphokinase